MSALAPLPDFREGLGVGLLPHFDDEQKKREEPTPNPSRKAGRGTDNAAFTSAATRLAGLAGALLGWRPGEFWDTTPAELACVLRVLAPEVDAPPDLAALMRRFPDDVPS